ncbi:MAG: thiolase family protein [Chloroflexi bacterium]|nr:thiolase family protein [Chloroflexota bacterium]
MGSATIAAAAMTRFAKQPDASLKSLTAEAVRGVMMAAGLEPGQIQAVYFANAVAGMLSGQEMIRGQVALSGLGFEHVPVFNVENACASGSTAFFLACQAVQSGACDAALVVGAEKLTHPDKDATFRAIGTALDVESTANLPAGRSPFMDVYAEMTRAYMERTGATARDFAAVAAKNQYHGSLNPLAQYGGIVTAEDVLASRPIVPPLTLLMCAPITDGAAALVVVGDVLARKLDAAGVIVNATALTSGLSTSPAAGSPAAGSSSVARLAAMQAYERAGLGPGDVDIVEVHDATAPAELMALEDVGLAPAGAALALLASGQTRLGGRLPVNPSGGLLARGHPLAATGIAQLCELTWQLQGRAGARQVAGARVALAENSGGWLGHDAAVGAVHILSRAT